MLFAVERLLPGGPPHVARPLGLSTGRPGDPGAFTRPDIPIDWHPEIVRRALAMTNALAAHGDRRAARCAERGTSDGGAER